jgi:hypothetical protein
MIDGHNLHLIVASNAMPHAHVLPIYYTFSHLKLQRFTLSGICGLFVVATWHYFICGTIEGLSFATFLVTLCVRLGLDE